MASVRNGACQLMLQNQLPVRGQAFQIDCQNNVIRYYNDENCQNENEARRIIIDGQCSQHHIRFQCEQLELPRIILRTQIFSKTKCDITSMYAEYFTPFDTCLAAGDNYILKVAYVNSRKIRVKTYLSLQDCRERKVSSTHEEFVLLCESLPFDHGYAQSERLYTAT